MEEKSNTTEKAKRVTPRWFINRVLLPSLPWVILLWFVTNLVIANNSVVLNPVSVRANVIDLEKQLKDLEMPGSKIVDVQKKRAELMIEYIDKRQVVKAREQLLTYKNWLDTNPNLSLDDRIEMRQQLANVYLALNEPKSAVDQYSLILQDLDSNEDGQSLVRKARYYNNLGAAYFLLSEASKDVELRKEYLTRSRDNLQKSQHLTDSKTVPAADSRALGYLHQIVIKNEDRLDDERTFTPKELLPENF